MANNILNHEWLRPVKFLMVSLGCHLIVIHLFSVSFTAQPVMLKPNFVFLGSILDSKDISRYVSQTPSNSDAVEDSHIDFFGRHLYQYKMSKPFVQNVKARHKQTEMRTVFEIESIEPEEGVMRDTAEEEFEFKIPEYNPLRLQ